MTALFCAILLCLVILISQGTWLAARGILLALDSESAGYKVRFAGLSRNPAYLIRFLRWLQLATFCLIIFLVFSPHLLDSRKAQWICLGFILLEFLLFELFAKAFSVRAQQVISMLFAPLLFQFQKLLQPLLLVIYKGNHFLDEQSDTNDKEMEEAIEKSRSVNFFEEETTRMLEGAARFGDTEVWQIMTPAADVEWFHASDSLPQLFQKIQELGFSRVPVKDENTILGILYVKDLIPHLHETQFRWSALVRPAYLIPPNKKIIELLEEFREHKIHIALIINEHGQNEGLVTLEDIVEEIVGDISDEFDDKELVYSKINEGTFIFDGSIKVKELQKVFSMSVPLHRNETLSKSLQQHFKTPPKSGDTLVLGDFTFTIEVADKRKIRRVKISRKS